MNVFGNNNVPSLLSEGVKKKIDENASKGYPELGVKGGTKKAAKIAKNILKVGKHSQEVANRTMSKKEQEEMAAERKAWRKRLRSTGDDGKNTVDDHGEVMLDPKTGKPFPKKGPLKDWQIPSLSEGQKRLKRQEAALLKKAGGIESAVRAGYGENAELMAHLKKVKRNEEDGDARNTAKKIKRAFKTHKNFKKLTGRGNKEYEARMARKRSMHEDYRQTDPLYTRENEEGDYQPSRADIARAAKRRAAKKKKKKEGLKDHQEHPNLLDRVEENRSRKTAKKRLSDMRPLTSKAKGALKKHLRKNPGQIDSLAIKHGSENLGRIYNPDSEK